MNDVSRRLLAVKEERVRATERAVREAQRLREAAADATRLVSEERGRQAQALSDFRERMLVDSGMRAHFAQLRAAAVHSDALLNNLGACEQQVTQAEAALARADQAAAQAQGLLHRALREREKASRQRDAVSARVRVARERRQQADLDEFAEAGALRRHRSEQAA